MPKTITGKWLLGVGNPVALGTLYLQLSQDAVISGTSQLAPKNQQFTLDATGAIPAATQIYGNDELLPTTTSYLLTVNQAGGGRVFGPEYYVIQGTSPININNLAPSSAPPTTSTSSTIMNRLFLNQGTVLSSGNFALSAGFGSTATVTSVVGTDSLWQVTITPGGTGIASNPTCTLTFADGAWPNAPIGISKGIGGTGGMATTEDTTATTTWTVTFVGLPQTGLTYIIEGICIGR